MSSTRHLWPLLYLSLGFVIPVQSGEVLNQPPDLSNDFENADNTVFVPQELKTFDLAAAKGTLSWKRKQPGSNMLFNNMVPAYRDAEPNEWPQKIYAADPELRFALEFVNASTFRLRFRSAQGEFLPQPSLMLVKNPQDDHAWKGERIPEGYRYASSRGSVTVRQKPWRIEVRDASGRILTQTDSSSPQSFAFVRRASDYSRSFSAVFSLTPGEKIFGCGESFTALDKRGQKFPLSTTDALGTLSAKQYKPVPFFLSSRGYGMFIHSSSPMTVDFGSTHAGRTALTVGDEELDLFVFLGNPKEILGEYTALTGRATMPPLWSFGLWMSRITYTSEQEARDVAANLRQNRLPADVIHLDTGWFQNDWECDYRFAKDRFTDPKKLIEDLKANGLRVSLWQLPYFIPQNPLFREIVDKGLAVKNAKGTLPTEDAILDFSNQATVKWYQEKLAGLLRLGVGAIKTDFGEAAPWNGQYASGSSGFYEHNLYPLRYQEAAAEVTRRETGDTIIWARAGWAGAQRNAVHWGGDPGKDFASMASSLRGGLSLGLSGFSFWSHDIGGFGGRNDLEVYRKWIPFGMLTSHSRVHGEPPKEPWLLGEDVLNDFRRADELRYRLMPYIYAQAKDSADRGLPMVRALFVEFPEDPGAWLVEDAYLFGSSMLVAPLLEHGATGRDVYLPAGRWIDYQTGNTYAGGWHQIEAGAVPAIILVRDGTILPHIALAQSTKDLDWTKLELAVYASEQTTEFRGLIYLPGDAAVGEVSVVREGAGLVIKADPRPGRVKWAIQPRNPNSAAALNYKETKNQR